MLLVSRTFGSACGHSAPGVPETGQIGVYRRAFRLERAPGYPRESPAHKPIPAALL